MRGNGGVSTGTFAPMLHRAFDAGGDHAARTAFAARTISDSTRRHHPGVVGVRLVELEHRELRIVRPVDPLVPEVVPDLVHPLEPADDQPLEVQLVGDAQVERHVERVVVRHERTRRRAAVQRLQHRRLDLEVVPAVETRADRARSCASARETARAPPGCTARSAYRWR